MPGGRPDAGRQDPHPELAELTAWFRRALIDAGYDSVNALLQRHPLEKNRIYGLFKGTRFLPLESTQAVAVALGRKPDEVLQLWWRAKAAMDRAAAEDSDGASRIESWNDLPWPHVALQDILEAQSHASDILPYHLLEVEPPPLSTVYVRQQAKPDPGLAKRDHPNPRGMSGEEPARIVEEVATPITSALDRHEHLIITGEPGAGKSTLAQFLALTLSRIWLRTTTGEDAPIREPVVPLRVTARGLTGGETWSATLARAARLALGSRLVAEPSASLFERRAQGVRWLILVDGLDEIVHPAARAAVIDAIAVRCRRGSNYRILLTSRQLSNVEFAPLRGQNVATYQLEPFGLSELESFARSWFQAQRASDAEADAAQFIRQVNDGGLGELVRNPLLATIAAIAYTVEPGRPLPSDRLGLYERFLEHLVLSDSSRRGTMSELRRLYADEPDRLHFVTWLSNQRMALLRHLAVARLDSERPLPDVARDWVQDHAPQRSVGWEDDLEIVLSGTGLLVYNSATARFLHHSFAEYLAAQEHAARIGPDFPDMQSWINRAGRPAEREFAMFVFAMWSARPGHDLGRIFDTLLGGLPDYLLLAGQLLARAREVTPEDNRRVVDRLVELAIGAAIVDGFGRNHDLMFAALSITPVTSVIKVLSQLTNNPYAASRLGVLADLVGAPMSVRVAALEALGKIGSAAEATQSVRRLLPLCRSSDLLAAARCLRTLTPDDPLASDILLQLGRDPTATTDVRAEASAELQTMDRLAEASDIAHAILSLRPITADTLGRSLATWLSCVQDPDQRSELVNDLIQQPLAGDQRRELSDALAAAGFRPEAGELATRVLVDPGTPPWRLAWAVKQCADLAGMSADDLREALATAVHPADLARAAEGLAEAGHRELALEFVHKAIVHDAADGFDIAAAVHAWLLAAGPTAISEVQESIESRLRQRRVSSAGYVATQFIEEGQLEAALLIARSVLRTQRTDDGSLWHAIQAWLAAGGANAPTDIRAAISHGAPLSADALAMAAEAAALGGARLLALDLAAQAFQNLVTGQYRTGSAYRAIILALGPQAREALQAIKATRPFDSTEWLSVTDHLLAAGVIEAAQEIWFDLLAHPATKFEHRVLAAARLVATGICATPTNETPDAQSQDHSAITALAEALEPFIQARTPSPPDGQR